VVVVTLLVGSHINVCG